MQSSNLSYSWDPCYRVDLPEPITIQNTLVSTAISPRFSLYFLVSLGCICSRHEGFRDIFTFKNYPLNGFQNFKQTIELIQRQRNTLEYPKTSQTCPRLHLDLDLVGILSVTIGINSTSTSLKMVRPVPHAGLHVVQSIQCPLIFINLCRFIVSLCYFQGQKY
jgi:hypothetical protein